MRSDRGYLEAILLASLLLLGGGYLTATSADEQEPVDLSFLDGDWDFNGLEAFVRPEPKNEAKNEAKNQARYQAKY